MTSAVVHEPAVGARRDRHTASALAHHLTLKLPTSCASTTRSPGSAPRKASNVRYLLRLAELELIDRERRMQRRIKAARFPVVKSPTASTSRSSPRSTIWPAASNRAARTSSRSATTGKHIALGLGFGLPEGPLGRLHHRRALVHELIEARDDKQLLRFQKKLATYKLLIVDELGFVPCRAVVRVFSQPTSGARPWSPPICPSTNGPRCSAPSASPGSLVHPPRQHPR